MVMNGKALGGCMLFALTAMVYLQMEDGEEAINEELATTVTGENDLHNLQLYKKATTKDTDSNTNAEAISSSPHSNEDISSEASLEKGKGSEENLEGVVQDVPEKKSGWKTEAEQDAILNANKIEAGKEAFKKPSKQQVERPDAGTDQESEGAAELNEDLKWYLRANVSV